MTRTSRVLAALGTVSLIAYGSALAQQPPGEPQGRPGAPPSPSSPASPGAGAAQAQETASGEIVSVDSKANTLSLKTSTGEMTFKYEDSTKISGAAKAAAGLATMTGSQATVRYRKDGASNIATSIDVKAGGAAKPGLPGDKPAFPGDKPGDKPGAPRP